MDKKDIIQILEDNRRETLFSLSSDNEAADIAIGNFIIAVTDEIELKWDCEHEWEGCKGPMCTSDLHTHHCKKCGKHAFKRDDYNGDQN